MPGRQNGRTGRPGLTVSNVDQVSDGYQLPIGDRRRYPCGMATPQQTADPRPESPDTCPGGDQGFDIFAAVCPSRDVFAELADKWSLLLLLSLHSCGEQRFSELQRAVGGVSRKMLTQSLRALERDGLVLRTVHPETPPRVVYGLLPLGRTLAERISPLGDWVESYAGQVVAARERFDQAHGGDCTP